MNVFVTKLYNHDLREDLKACCYITPHSHPYSMDRNSKESNGSDNNAIHEKIITALETSDVL